MSTGQRVRKTPTERQDEIREAARTIALTHGLNEVTTRALASTVGSAPGLISHYVPSMDALRAETFTLIVAEELQTIKTETAGADDTIGAIRFLTTTLFVEESDPITGIWLDGWSLGRRLTVMAEAVRNQMNAWQQFVVALIRKGRSDGLFDVDNLDVAAWRLVSLIDGLNAHSMVQYRSSEERSWLLAQSIENELHLDRGTLTQTLQYEFYGGSDDYANTCD